MKFSIVIPTYNRVGRLKLVLKSLNSQVYPFDQFEVLTVSDGSTDGTNQYLSNIQTHYQLKSILQENKGVASARNAGIHAAIGEIIIFIDDDTVPEKHFLHEHQRVHDECGPNTIVLGPMLAPPDHEMDPWVSWEQSRLLEQYADMASGRWLPTPRQFYTANASIARKHLLNEGGFDPAFRRAEDVELAYRLEKRGLRFVFNPEAIVYHYAERSFASWVAIPYAYGINDVIFAKEKNQYWLLPTIFEEYHQRHRLIKTLTQMCMDHKSLSLLTQHFLKGLSLIFSRVNLDEFSHLACGGIFNLQYYQGIADGLGGRRAFFASVKSSV